MYLKVHGTVGNRVVAVCDSELIGKILEDKKIYMDLDKHRGFYIGEQVEENEVKKELIAFSSINLVGKQAVKIAVDMKLVTKRDVMYINNIPYIQVYRI